MQKLEVLIEVLIEENSHGSMRPVEVVADAPVAALIPALVEELQLPQTDHLGNKLVYMLRYASGGRILPEYSTLLAAGVEQGARLSLDSYVVDGSVATLMRNAHQSPSPDILLHSSETLADANGLPIIGQTPGLLPAYVQPKKHTWTRRSFLILGGVALGASSIGLGYAAYHSLNGALNTTNMMGAMRPTVAQKTPTMANAVIPTMAKPGIVFTGHQQNVRAVAWSPDGTMLASGADDAQLLIWGTDGAIHQTIQHPASVRAVAWSPDGQRLVTGSNTQVLFLNALTGTTLGRSTHRHIAPVTSLAWNPHNQLQVVSAGLDNRAIVWDTTKYHAHTTFTHHDTAIEAVSWAADGQTIASASHGGAIRVWRAADGQELHGYYQDARIPMRALAFASRGMTLAVGGDDGIVRLRNAFVCQQQHVRIDGMQCIDVPQRLQASRAAIRSIAWSPDGRFLAIGSDDGVFSLWYPTQNQKPLLTMTVQQNTPVHSVTWSSKGDQLATAAGNKVTLWSLM